MSDSDVEEQILDYEHEELSSYSEHDQGSGRATPVSQSGRAAARRFRGLIQPFLQVIYRHSLGLFRPYIKTLDCSVRRSPVRDSRLPLIITRHLALKNSGFLKSML